MYKRQDVVIGCDTVVDVDGAVFGKPADRDDARRMIRVLAGRGHLAVSYTHLDVYKRQE